MDICLSQLVLCLELGLYVVYSAPATHRTNVPTLMRSGNIYLSIYMQLPNRAIYYRPGVCSKRCPIVVSPDRLALVCNAGSGFLTIGWRTPDSTQR